MSIIPSKRFVASALVLLVAVALLGGGRIVTREDPLKKADAIYVLAGSWVQRWMEGADLYLEGFAPHIVLSNGTFDEGERELKRRGIRFPGPGELSRAVMIDQLKIPAEAIEVIGESLDNTAQEAAAIKSFVTRKHWRSLIVITDRASTRRAGFALRRELGPDVEIIMRAPRLDSFPPDGWWRTRANFRTVFYEFPKFVAYLCGLKG